MGDQREKEVISGYWSATSGEKQTGEGSSYPVEATEHEETAQTTPREVMQLRRASSRKCRDHVSSNCERLEEAEQRTSPGSSTSRNKAKDFEYDKIMHNILKLFFKLV